MERKIHGVCLLCLEKEAAAANRPFLRPALGIHPKHCAHLPADALEQLRTLAANHHMIAISEMGLDYSLPPEELDKQTQKLWFRAQIQLTIELDLPLILHIRDAYADALDILRQHRDILHGGVAHCFAGDLETAMACAELGFAVGIGGRLPQDENLQAVVARVPLCALVVETDAPYIRPDISHLSGSGKQRKKVRNSSLILPPVIEKIASVRGEASDTVEEAIFQNTPRIFHLNER